MSQREEGSAESRVLSSACHQCHQKEKEKKNPEMKEKCKFFLATILKRIKFCWEIGHKRCEGVRKEGRTFVCNCSIKVGLF